MATRLGEPGGRGWMVGLTPDMIADYKESFDNFDKDGNGEISAQDLGCVLRSLGLALTDRQVRATLDKWDGDGDGVVTFNEFIAVMRQCEASSDFEADVQRAFEFFDADSSGGISADELSRVMRGLGANLSDSEIELLIREADSNKDGEIDLQDFMSLVCG